MDSEAAATVCKEYFVVFIYYKIVRVNHAYAIAGVALWHCDVTPV